MQALALNEFEGETFDCGGDPLQGCISTGEMEIARLSFNVWRIV
jgi:hypothetical protein